MEVLKLEDLNSEPQKRGAKIKYPFNDLNVGECFVIKNKPQQSISPICVYHNNKSGKVFKTRRAGNDVIVYREH